MVGQSPGVMSWIMNRTTRRPSVWGPELAPTKIAWGLPLIRKPMRPIAPPPFGFGFAMTLIG